MSSSALRIIAILLAIGAIFLGYMGYKAGQPTQPDTVETAEQITPEPVRFPVIVAAREIAADQLLQQEDVTSLFVEQQAEGGFADSHLVIGRKTRMPIQTGDRVLKAHFHELSALVNAIREGERAIAIRVDEVTGAGGFIEPGDKVDVLLFLSAGQEAGNYSSAQLVLPAVRVLAYGNMLEDLDEATIAQKARLTQSDEPTDVQSSTAARDDDKATGRQSKTAVLAVAEQDMSKLLLAESSGRLRLALLGPDAMVADHQHQSSEVQQADQKHLAERRRQLLTLESLVPASAKQSTPSPITQTQPVRVAPAPVPASQKITIHRGAASTTISVDKEN